MTKAKWIEYSRVFIIGGIIGLLCSSLLYASIIGIFVGVLMGVTDVILHEEYIKEAQLEFDKINNTAL